jgi:glycopeptide antibiotics resistance protein
MSESTATPTVSRTRRPSQVVARVALAVYLVFLLLVVFWPTPVDRDAGDLIERIVAFINRRGIESFRYSHLEWLANVALFAPFGFLLTFIVRRWWVAPLFGILLSVGIELGQRVLLPERFASPADVAANGIGAIVGAFFALALVGATRIADRAP